jgi:hypothetical protein
MYRWLIGFWLGECRFRSAEDQFRMHLTSPSLFFLSGSRECCQEVESYFESPNLYVIVMLTLAFALILIASFLALSTLLQLSRGDLTIDVEVRKALMRQKVNSSTKRAQRHFWIPPSEGRKEGSVISIDAVEQPYDLGNWRDNLRAALW